MMTTSPLPFAEELKRRNRNTRDAWGISGDHRAHATQLLAEAAESLPRPRRVCLLGAGNCNDVALCDLLQAYDEVHLVDLDADALAEGVARQEPAAKSRIKMHGRMDVTGCLTQLAKEIRPGDDAADRLDEWIERIKTLPPFPQPSPFHVVASMGMMTQIGEMALLMLGGPAHPRGNELLFALRNHHLRKLFEMTRPGGIAFLMTDVVSSFTFPNLPLLSDDELPRALMQQVALKNFFTGANPYAIEALVRNDPNLSGRVRSVEMLAPWRWRQGGRTMLMSGIKVCL